MAETTHISWADATLNWWVGCTKVSTGEHGACEFCYAETWAKRWPQYRDTWGPGAPRVQFKHLLSKAKAIEAKGKREGRRQFVFSNSLSDIFDNEVPIEWLAEAFEIMRATPGNVYLLLTKRPQNIVKRFCQTLPPGASEDGPEYVHWPSNVAIGCTVVTQAEANRDVPWLLRAKATLQPAFAFLSMEPLMGAVDLTHLDTMAFHGAEVLDALSGRLWGIMGEPAGNMVTVDWVITGGESGVKARPSDPAWFRSLRDQCAAAGVAFHHKQNGEWVGSEELAEEPAVDYRDMGRPADMVWRVGKKADPCTLDGVKHDARPKVTA